MLKRTGNIKLIDLGSAVDVSGSATRPMWSPAYAAPEVLEDGPNSPQADLASLGYVLVEMLAGQSPLEGLTAYGELLAAKTSQDQRLTDLLPEEVSRDELRLNLSIFACGWSKRIQRTTNAMAPRRVAIPGTEFGGRRV